MIGLKQFKINHNTLILRLKEDRRLLMNKVSKFENINSSYRNVKKRRITIKKWLSVFFSPQVIAHYASVITISGLYFSGKEWKISVTNFNDVIVAILSIFAIIYGLVYMRDMFYEYKMKVGYSELHDLLTVARYEAQSSIINISGDLSWLDKDIESLKDIKSEHPDLQIKIYYDNYK